MRARAEQPGKHRRTEGSAAPAPDKQDNAPKIEPAVVCDIEPINDALRKKSSRKRAHREVEEEVGISTEHEEDVKDRKKKKKKSKRTENSVSS